MKPQRTRHMNAKSFPVHTPQSKRDDVEVDVNTAAADAAKKQSSPRRNPSHAPYRGPVNLGPCCIDALLY